VLAEKGDTGIRRYIPILAWLPQYQAKWLRFDIIAGLTIMALLVPEGMAYAELAARPSPMALKSSPLTAVMAPSRKWPRVSPEGNYPWPSCPAVSLT